eukprot:TRINITY_DN7407_c0_g1_i1.p2 TRINITY_DN7407_c0_g1~~TRINITY_DN7407_c0_g1_i1.p2  ORF type:complete len:264 (+),score=46.77 TRINITY_DN7407_c0_g1_i1:55-846(+)
MPSTQWQGCHRLAVRALAASAVLMLLGGLAVQLSLQRSWPIDRHSTGLAEVASNASQSDNSSRTSTTEPLRRLSIGWRCGSTSTIPVEDGSPAMCVGAFACCSPRGECGLEAKFCECAGCIDYRKLPEAKSNSTVAVRTVPCAGAARLDAFPNRCCKGMGCCLRGVARIIPGQRANWTGDSAMVLVVPQAAIVGYTRGGGRDDKQWLLSIGSAFPYVLCPACAVVESGGDSICTVPTNMGAEAAFYLSFIVCSAPSGSLLRSV